MCRWGINPLKLIRNSAINELMNFTEPKIKNQFITTRVWLISKIKEVTTTWARSEKLKTKWKNFKKVLEKNRTN